MKTYGTFETLQELGRGATATVYLAKDTRDGSFASLKVFHPGVLSQAFAKKRIEREVASLSKLSHPAIIKIKEAFLESDPPAIAMEYVDGENLETYQARLPYILPEVPALAVMELAGALEHAHECGVIHRDIKPENILVSKEGRLYLTDFGLARTDETLTQMTQAGGLVGSLDYLAPEQARGEKTTEAADVFSLAGVLYFLVTGTKPFSRPSPAAILRAIESEEVEAPFRRNPKVSRKLSDIILHGLKKDPSDRISSARAFRVELENYLSDVGMGAAFPSFRDWHTQTPKSTFEGLRVLSERLIERCEQAIQAAKGERFAELLQHLSLVAPESPEIEKLLNRWKGRKRRLAFWLSAVVTVAAVLVVVTWISLPKPKPAQAPAMVVEAPPKILAAPAAVVEKPAPKPVSAPKTKVPEPPMGTVYFKLDPEVKVLWDGEIIEDSSAPLLNQKPGKHLITLEKPGYTPIEAQVWVKVGEPTVISARQ